jgi:hypothetical protein
MYEYAIWVLESKIRELRGELSFSQLNGSPEVAKGFEVDIYRVEQAIKILKESEEK